MHLEFDRIAQGYHGDSPYHDVCSGLGLAACGRSSRSQEPERLANTEYAFTMLLDLKIQRSCCIIILMVLVAVAGGTSPGLGRSIVRALQEHPDHTPIVLSRLSSKTPKWMEDMGADVRKVDYHSQESLVPTLKDVHTVRPTPILRLCNSS